jgi:hypothetical protein
LCLAELQKKIPRCQRLMKWRGGWENPDADAALYEARCATILRCSKKAASSATRVEFFVPSLESSL